jgi:two-component system, OmpR family, sensor histidine kinase CiaH
MPKSPYRRTLVLFSLLAAYVVLQFLWWAYLLVSKDNELQALLGQLQALGVTSTLDHDKPERTLWMVSGEGAVFLTLLLLALWLTYRTVRHELGLARLQRNFLLAASHELRTPIAGLKLHLQTLQRRPLDDAQRQALLSTALGEVDRLGALSEKILLATRLEEVHLPMHHGAVDLAALLRALIEQARLSYGRDHAIILSAPDELTITTDAEALRAIIGNLIENACKYAPGGTQVSLEMHLRDGSAEVLVSDEGPGVSEADRGRIFERFFRGGQEETRNTKGTGLGLYIVHRLVQELGGTVEHRPRAPHGSIFAVAIPDR